ncbi:S41 family peptidase [Peptostreptococcus stomatis]|uniref:S41 family peptidase n=2 Tax=Peptostreptococcus stomatis TaxID=341694 RepID=UPI001A4D7A75|nr:S41 family peptidase [Peptostreptococcus stomatis]MBL6465067.1 S41 family peptidase [Peptostreptococcus stomatis]
MVKVSGEMKNNIERRFFKTILVVLVTAIVTSFVLVNVGFLGFVPPAEYKRYAKYKALEQSIKREFYKKPDEKKLEDATYKGLFSGLDDVYSAYYTADEMKQLLEVATGKYVGIGFVVGADKATGAIRVESVMNNSPAKESGVKKGDLVVAVNGKKYSYMEMDIAVKNIRGPENTSVKITFLRDGKKIDKTITRKEIKIVSIESKMLEDKIGYINIKSFEEETAEDFRKALASLEAQGMKALIIDVRDDGGGLLTVVEDICDRILGKAVIVYTKDRQGKKEYLKSSDKEKIDKPIVVLTNRSSASASEILTGAVLDNKAGISIGETTYGKGLVQGMLKLKDGSGYKLTTAQYFTPNGNYIDKKGIKPTIEVKDKDQQLPKAIEYLKGKINK